MLDHVINAVLLTPVVLLAAFIGWCFPPLGIGWIGLGIYIIFFEKSPNKRRAT
jgi:hypothetical protein